MDSPTIMNLYDEAIEAIRKLHGDTSVSPAETLSSLKGLRDEIDVLTDAVESDIKRAERDT